MAVNVLTYDARKRKHKEILSLDTNMLLLNCALKLVEEIILYYDARSKKHQNRKRFTVIIRRYKTT